MMTCVLPTRAEVVVRTLREGTVLTVWGSVLPLRTSEHYAKVAPEWSLGKLRPVQFLGPASLGNASRTFRNSIDL